MSSNLMHATSPAVETHLWVDTTSVSSLVANFARVHMLVSFFDGDPAKWLELIETSGTLDERVNDLPFVLAMQDELERDPGKLETMRRLVQDVSELFTR